jgi:hypothetical protein
MDGGFARPRSLNAIVKGWSATKGTRARKFAVPFDKAVCVLGRPLRLSHRPQNCLSLSTRKLVVRHIYRLYLHENSVSASSPAASMRRACAPPHPWSMVSIRDIPRNRAYLGT